MLMADVVDDAQAVTDMQLRHSIAAARKPIPAGAPGECDVCGRDSPRLVKGACAPCRDRRAKVSAR
jgi:hypothetical protein